MAVEAQRLEEIALAELDDDLKEAIKPNEDSDVRMRDFLIALQVQQTRFARTTAYYAEELCRKT